MGRAVHPGRAHEILAPEEQTARLRPAQALAAAVGDERRAVLQVHVRDGEDLGGRIDDNRNSLRLGQRSHDLQAQRALVDARARHDVDEGRSRAERGFELRDRRDFDHAQADGTDRRVVDIARVGRDDGFVPGKTTEVRQPHVQIRVAAGHAGRGGERQPRRATVGDEAPLGSGEHGQTRADGFRELVEVHVLPCRRVHRRPHLRQHRRTADDGEGAAGVDERAHADRRVDVRARLKPGGGRRSERWGAGSLAFAEHGARDCEQTA